MKIFLLLLFLCSSLTLSAQVQDAIWTTNPAAFDEDEEVTITVSGVDPSIWGVTDVYLWAWRRDGNGNYVADSPTNGDWTNSDESQKMTDNGDGTFSYTLIPTDFYEATVIEQMGVLAKAKDGDPNNKTEDKIITVGRVGIQFIEPSDDIVILSSGSNQNIIARISSGGSTTVMGTYEVFFNNVSVATGTCGFPNCVTSINNITQSGTVRFVGTPPNSSDTGEASFDIIIEPTVTEEAIPVGIVDGINYGPDDTKATLVLSAPGKEFIQVAASWNSYSPSDSDVMKYDPNTDKFWLEISGLTANEVETYQYWVYDTNPVADSPVIVKTADPYSTLVLSPFDDAFIPAATFPDLPAYPVGQQREVTVLETGQAAYPWQVTNFNKPKKEDLIVYELLVRDFDADRNYQDIIDRIDYFKNLNINAIELMPVMEFEGNESWGYNTAFHMALDKFYGTPEKFKELVDVCHQNGIAVILDIAFNHAFGRNPMVRMWMDDPDGDGWGGPATNNPYFNVFPQHAFSVGNDFDHSTTYTRDYVKQVIGYWITEYKIDGLRWDLTKGFTQNCGNGTYDGDFGCTQNYQQDRVDVLKDYADHSWLIDADHYVIFEHLGGDTEEKEWANYRLGEGKGIMMWGKMTDTYNELTMGQNGNKDINRIGHKSHAGFNGPRVIGYPESHDEERLMYKNLEFGSSANPAHDVKDLDVALSRMSALAAVSVMVPGPKMIWHFGELGMENSIFTCQNGTVNLPSDGIGGDCKLDTKPQPQWTDNWLSDPDRAAIYNDWSRLHFLKINEPVFEGDYTITSSSSNFTPRIDIFDTNIPVTELRNVVILSNFSVSDINNASTSFPFNGEWYDLMDETGNTKINVVNTSAEITIPAGQFRIFGNQPAETLSTNDLTRDLFALYPNPTSTSFYLNIAVKTVEIYDISGKRIKSFNGDFERNMSFDITSIKSGIYLVKITNGDGLTNTTKLVKL